MQVSTFSKLMLACSTMNSEQCGKSSQPQGCFRKYSTLKYLRFIRKWWYSNQFDAYYLKAQSVLFSSNSIQVRCINGIIHHLIHIFVSMAYFRCLKVIGHLQIQKPHLSKSLFLSFLINASYGNRFFFSLPLCITSSASSSEMF